MIGRLTRAARKLRGRSPDEFRERGAQALAAWRERAGLAPAELAVDAAALRRRLAPDAPRDPDALLAAYRARRPAFVPAFDDPEATVAALRAHAPQDEPAVLARAERVLAGRFDLLGYQGLSYGDPVDWQLDPVRRLRAPEVHWSRVPYLDASVVGDHKVTWEVSRQQYLVTLGQAYWYTRDERYARAACDHVAAWLDANPPKRGINWASSLEVAFRAMSWVWALHYFRHSPSLSPALYARLLNALHVHARHLERYLSTYFSPNTHLTGEALGLVHVGAFVPELALAGRWRRTGLDVLTAWLPRQVRADGGYFEQATQYHRYTTEFALHLLLLDSRHGWGVADRVRPVLERLLDYLQAVTRPDGTIPLVGDDDGGKLVHLDGAPPDDVRGVFAQAAAWLGAPELAHSAGDPAAGHALAAAGWLLGASGMERLLATAAREPAERSRAFRDTGVLVLRDGWGPGAMHAVADCGPHGAFNAGHAHADVLSLTASAHGRALLVDCGTYAYVGVERNEFRGADAHNVLLVDGEGSAVPAADAFQWTHVAHGRLLAWEADDAQAYFEGTHDGFARLPDPVRHRRAVLFVAGLGWVVRDRIEARGEHTARAHWHLAPGLAPAAHGQGPRAVVVDGVGEPVLVVAAFGGEDTAAALAAEPAWVSPRYGARVPGVRLVWEQRAQGAQDVVTFLLPIAAGATLPEVGVQRHGDARTFVIRVDEARTTIVADAGGLRVQA